MGLGQNNEYESQSQEYDFHWDCFCKQLYASSSQFHLSQQIEIHDNSSGSPSGTSLPIRIQFQDLKHLQPLFSSFLNPKAIYRSQNPKNNFPFLQSCLYQSSVTFNPSYIHSMDSQHWELAPVNDNFTKTHQAPLAEVLEHYAVMGVIAKMSIPPIESLRTAKKHFVVEQYMNNKGEKAEVYYIQINTADKKTYRINIVDVNFCHNLNFEVQWASNLGDNFKIRNPIEATVTANCVDYKPSQEERIQRAQPSYKGKLPLDQEWLGLEPQPNPEPPKKEKQKKKATPQRQVLVHPNLTLEQIKQINRQEAEQQPQDKSQESDLGDMGYEEDMRRLSMQPREVFLDYYEYTEVTKETLKVMLANWCKEDIDNSFTTKKQVEQFLQENGILLRKLQLKELLEETFDPLKVGRMNGFRLKQLFMKPHVREKVDKHLEQLVQFHQPRPKSKKYCKKGGTK